MQLSIGEGGRERERKVIAIVISHAQSQMCGQSYIKRH